MPVRGPLRDLSCGVEGQTGSGGGGRMRGDEARVQTSE